MDVHVYACMMVSQDPAPSHKKPQLVGCDEAPALSIMAPNLSHNDPKNIQSLLCAASGHIHGPFKNRFVLWKINMEPENHWVDKLDN